MRADPVLQRYRFESLSYSFESLSCFITNKVSKEEQNLILWLHLKLKGSDIHISRKRFFSLIEKYPYGLKVDSNFLDGLLTALEACMHSNDIFPIPMNYLTLPIKNRI